MLVPVRDETATVHAAAGLYLALLPIVALWMPALLWPLLLGALGLGALILGYARLTPICVLWLLIVGITPEMAASDLIGPEAFQPTIAAVKAAEIVLAGLCALRYGVRLDAFNPAWAFLAMGAAGLVSGLYPGLTQADSVRSIVGSAAPFAFFFCRPPPNWASAMIRAVAWCPSASVAVGLIFSLADLRPLFIDSGGARLAAVGHPAFLAGVCLSAIYAGLFALYRDGRRGDRLLLATNWLILVLTGARAPLMYAALVMGASLILVRSAAFPARSRLLLGLAALPVLPPLLLASEDLAAVRLFNMLSTDAGNLSGREFLWPAFEQAAAEAPWFGWGVGAGNAIIPPDSPIAMLLHTWAAHNEYLRIQVEGGEIGRALLILLFALWVWLRSRVLPVGDSRLIRLIFMAFAGHAFTDNVLISTPACVLFALIAAIFVRGEAEARGTRL